MYRAASLSVWILLSLSEGRVGIIFRSDVNASLRDCVRCLSRMLAMTRCVWRSSKERAGLLLASLPPLPALPPPLSQLFLNFFLFFIAGLGLCASPSSSSVSAPLLAARRFLAPLRGSWRSVSSSLLPALSIGEESSSRIVASRDLSSVKRTLIIPDLTSHASTNSAGNEESPAVGCGLVLR